MIYDVAVLGLGTMGAFTCLELAKRGVSVVGVDRFEPPHGFGSHSGDTRVFRTAYAESPLYVELARHAGTLWDSYGEEAEVPLLTRSGMLSMGPADGELITGIRRSAELHAIPVEVLTRGEIRNRYPVFTLPENYAGAFESAAGWIDVEASIRFALGRARQNGARLFMNQADVRWEARSGEILIRTGTDTFSAKQLIITVGAWASGFLPQLPLTLRRKVMIWVAPHDPAEYAPGTLPVFATEEKFFYGFPNVRDSGVKLAIHANEQDSSPENPAHVDPPTPEDVLAVLRCAAKFLPTLTGRQVLDQARVLRAATCLYTMTPDEHFIIDRHRSYENVCFAAGFSGHGFKFAPAIAEVLADMATEREPALPVSFLRADRFERL